MKWILALILCLSLGLNVGLGLRLAGRDSGEDPFPPPSLGEDPAVDDTVWQRRLERRFDRLAAVLKLGPEQRAAFRELHAEGADRMQRRYREVAAGRRRLLAQVTAGDVDTDSVRTVMADLSRRQVALDSLAADRLLRELEILTPDQRREYLRLLPLDRFGGPGRKGHGPRGGHGARGHRQGRPGGG